MDGENNTAVPKFGAAPSTDDIAARLAREEGGGSSVAAPGGAPHQAEPVAEEPAPAFDVSKLSPEMLIALRAALDATPLRATKKGNPTIKIRRIEGKFVLKVGKAYQTLVHDDVANTNIEKVMIKVKFMQDSGAIAPEWTIVEYKDFMNADQIKCEVVTSRSENETHSEGEVESNERPGVMVELTVTTVRTWFTIKLPEGSPVPQVEVEGEIANG